MSSYQSFLATFLLFKQCCHASLVAQAASLGRRLVHTNIVIPSDIQAVWLLSGDREI